MKVLAIPPPRQNVSALSRKFLMTPIFVSIFAPPRIMRNGLSAAFISGERFLISFSMRNPAYAGRCSAMPAVEAWARWAVAKASET